jgi:hypothetical protein
MATFGTLPYGTSVTRMPLGRMIERRGGTRYGFGVPGTGGTSRCAATLELSSNRATVHSARRRIIIRFLPRPDQPHRQ